MIGGGFQHADSSCGWEFPKHIQWDKTGRSGNISVHIDDSIFNVLPDKTKFNIAWFCESPAITKPYADLLDNEYTKEKILNNFNLIFTSDKSVLKKHKELKYLIPHAFPWVEEKKIFEKLKKIYIIASGKNFFPGHILRHNIIEIYKNYINVFGNGYFPIKSKNEGLNDFMFSFAIENITAAGYFTEKVTDCFATGTVPIYWGDETINDYFLEDGIVRLNDDFDLSSLTEDFYHSKKEIIKENFVRSINLPLPEDYIYLNYFK
jgi:hypothetical protein